MNLQLLYFLNEPVDVAGSDGKQYFGFVCLQVGEKFFFAENPFVGIVNEREQIFGGDAGDGLLARRVYGQQNHFV